MFHDKQKKMPSSRSQALPRSPRVRKIALALVSLLASAQLLFPYAAVATGYFASPTPGIANVPMPFNLGGGSFGEINDAVNLATGNVYADLGGQSLNNPDPAATSTRAPKLSTTATTRLIGFQGQGGSEEIGNDDLTGGQWGGYGTKPATFVGYTIKAQDGNGCGSGANGIVRRQALNPGHYRVAFDGRSTGNAFNVNFGLDDSHGVGVTLNTTWQTFTQEFDLSQQNDGRIFQVVENTPGNPDWEVLRFSVQQLVNGQWTGNLITNSASGDWGPYCNDQTLTPFYRLGSQDFSGSDPVSGVIYHGVPKVPGTYTLQFTARTRLGTLAVTAGVDDHNASDFTLNTNWQTLTKTFNVSNDQNGLYDRDRLFEILERTPSNIEWELKGVSVKSNRALPNQIGNQDLTDSTWAGYSIKPGVQPVYHIKAQDQGCGATAANGLLHDQTLPDPHGRYRLTFDARSTGSSFPAAFGTDDAHMTGIQLNNAWQNYSTEFTLNGQQGGARNQRAFQVLEGTPNNPDWEVSGFQIQQWVNNGWGYNLIVNNGIGDWYGYCTQYQVNTFYRLNPADDSNGYSGLIYQAEKRLPGTYIVTVQARTRNGTLPIRYGLDDHFNLGATLNDQWQTLRTSFTVTAANIQDYNLQRSFEVFESTRNNPAWELQNVSVEPVVDTLSLQSGDGAAQTYQRIQPDFSQTPSWITRYQGDASVALYKVRPAPGTTADDAWLAVKTVNSNKVGHLYDQQGNRTTFYSDGEFADYVQTPYQQYRSAVNGDPDGLNASSPKTQFNYTSPTSGHLSSVRDEYGRTNTYEWNESTGTLNAINLLLQTDGNNSTYAKRIEYTYGSFANQRVVTNVVFRTYRAEGTTGGRTSEQRNFGLSYKPGANNAVMLASITAPILGNYFRTTRYDYDAQNRVVTIRSSGLPDTTLAYGAAQNVSGGSRVTQVQGSKVQVYEFTPQGWLRHSSVAVIGGGQNKSPSNASVWSGENTSYGYDANGHVVAVRLPSGAQTRSTYDARGDLREVTRYYGTSAPSDTWNTDAPSGGYQHTAYTYDNDHQLTLEARDGVPTQGPSESTYSYNGVSTQTTPDYYSALNGTFRAIHSLTVKVSVNGVVKRASKQVFTDHGLLDSQSVLDPSASTETAYRTTKYSYGQSARSDLTSGIGGQYAVIQERVYGDQLYTRSDAGRTLYYAYDMFGNVSHQQQENAVVARWDANGSTQRRRETILSYDGFGNLAMKQIVSSEGSKQDYTPESMDYTHYLDTGEVDYQLSGSSANVTTYAYGQDAGKPEYGQVTGVNHGIGSATGSSPSASVSTSHGSRKYTYDAYGRVSGVTTDGDGTFLTSTSYDTLDRPVSVTAPDGSSVATEYDTTGQVSEVIRTDTPAAGSQVSTTVHTHDALGREVATTLPNGAVVSTTFDVFGQPIKITDGRLEMLSAAGDRSTYLQYDDLGQLIKKLGPVLVNTGRQYTDARRPYTTYAFDGYGRQTEVKALLYGGTVSPGTLDFPSGATTTSTTTAYDVFDEPIKVTDPLGYTTELNYDDSGNVVTRIQQKWRGGETDSATVGASGSLETVVTHTAFNLAGQPVQRMDARNNSRKLVYDVVGNVTQQIDARGIVTRVNQYLSDGLLDSVWEPKLDGSAGPTTADLSKFVATEQDVYDAGRSYPHIVNRALMTSGAAGSPNSTTYVYDYAGRPTGITLPAANTNNTTTTLSKSYDSQGNVVSETDANGFATGFSYDWAGRLTGKSEQARSGNSTDSNAGLAGGLQSAYTYDASGNLTQKTERGLISSYQYNSLGKVIAESRPHTSARGDLYWKLSTYRLDGLKTAQTTYDYGGSLSSHPDVVAANDPNISVDTGNVTLMEYNARGDQWAELSYAGGHNVESAWWQNVDGLGQRYRRVFTGWTGIYAPQRDTNGQLSGDANYLTYWKSDANGNLIEKWDTAAVANGSIWSARNSMDVQNDFKYTYSPSNKVLTENRTVEVKPGGTLLASSNASVTTTYNPRDLIATVNATEQLPVVSNTSGDPTGRSLTYSYYTNGAVSSINGTGGTRTSTYDARGRETTVVAPGGTTTTTYDPDGTQTDTVTGRPTGYSSNPNADITLYTSSSKPTVAGLVASSSTSTPPEGKVSSQSNTYNSAGQLTQNVTTSSSYQQASMTDTTTFAYNAYGQRLSGTAQASNSAGNYTSYAATYSDVAGNMTSETTGVRPASPLTSTFTLDSRGNRLATAGNGNYSGAVKRYNAEGQVAEITYASQVQSPDPHITSGTMYHYRYDPSGQRILFSHGGQISDGEGGSLLYRDENSTVSVGGQVQVTFRRAGDKGNFCSGEGGCKNHDSYSQNGYKFKDNTYSLAIGYNDPVSYDGVVPFALPKSRVRGLQAPVTALSNKLRINPLDVKPGAALPRLPDPAKVTQAGTDTSPATAPSGAQPAPAAPAASVQVGTGSPVLGVSGAGSSTTVSSVQPLNTQPVTASSPAAIRTSALPDPSKVQAPVTSTPGTASAMQNGTQNSSVGAAPVGSDSPRTVKSPGGQVIAAEVPDDFDDGTGFKYAVYAQDVRALAYEWNYNLSLVDNISAAYHQALESQKMSQGDKKRVDDARGAAYGALKSANQFTGQGKIPLWDLKFALDRVGELMVFGNVNPKDQVQFYNDLTSGIKGGSISQQDIIEIGKRSTAFEYQVGKTLEIASIRGHEMSELYQSYWDSQRIKDSVLAMPQFLKEYQQTDRSTGRVRFLDVHFANRNDGVTDYGFDLAMIIATGGEWLVAKSVARLGEMGTVRGLETLGTQGIERGGFDEAYSFGSNCFRKGFNSFTPSTSVRTLTGLVAIGALTVGTPVLAFNESTQQNGYYPITAVHRNLDPALTYLSLKDGRTGQPEAVTTTPEHPFYVQTQADTQTRPKPVGHEDLNSHWVGAGHLQIGDKIREADGSVGTVANVVTVQQTQEMFNLTVDTAHTFYVGDKGWLVHNGDGCPIWSLDPKRGLANAENAIKHWRSHAAEFPEYANASDYVKGARDFFSNIPKDAVTKVRGDGSIVIYQPSTERFGLYMSDGTPRTYMKVDIAGFHPNSGIKTGMDYFNAQK